MIENEQQLEVFATKMGEIMAAKMQETRVDCGFCSDENRRKQHLKEHMFLGYFLNVADVTIKWAVVGLLGYLAWLAVESAIHLKIDSQVADVEPKVKVEKRESTKNFEQ